MSRLMWTSLLLLFLYALLFAFMSRRNKDTPHIVVGRGALPEAEAREGESTATDALFTARERVLSGRVTDEYGYPLFAVEVAIADRPEHVVITDQAGEYRLRVPRTAMDVDPDVVFRKKGWASLHSPVSALEAGFSVQLRPTRLRGRVLDPDAQPVKHARIITLGADDWWNETTTDSHGLFLVDPPPGPVQLTARSHRFVTAHIDRLDIEAGTYTDVVVRMTYGVVLRTRFIDAGDAPISDVDVTVHGIDGRLAGGHTDARGQVRFQGLGVDTATLVAVRPGHAELIERFRPPSGSGEERRTFRLAPACPSGLDLALPTGLEPAAVELSIAREGQVLYQGPASDREALQILGAGRDYLFTFRAEDCPPVQRRWRPPPAGGGVLAVRLERGGHASGVVFDALGRPVSGATVRLHPVSHGGDVAASPRDPQTHTDTRGRFTVMAARGSYRVEVECGPGERPLREVQVEADRVVDLGPLVVTGGGDGR